MSNDSDFWLAEKPKVEELQMDWLRSEDLKEEKERNRLCSHYSSGASCGALSLPSGVQDGSMSDIAIFRQLRIGESVSTNADEATQRSSDPY